MKNIKEYRDGKLYQEWNVIDKQAFKIVKSIYSAKMKSVAAHANLKNPTSSLWNTRSKKRQAAIDRAKTMYSLKVVIS